MALGGNPIFNGKNFRGATQAPPVPQAYGQNQYGQTRTARAATARPPSWTHQAGLPSRT